MNSCLLSLLRCPFCGGQLQTSHGSADELGYGVLSCYCGQFPIVAGIPILRKGYVNRVSIDQLVQQITVGRYQEALAALVFPPEPISPLLAPDWIRRLPSLTGFRRLKRLAHEHGLREWRGEARAVLANTAHAGSACEFLDFYFRRSAINTSTAYEYFAYRFGQPRHLVALSLLTTISKPLRPLLELGCGAGHNVWSLLSRADGQLVVGIDKEFAMLYVAKTWMAPEAQFVCADADVALPFPADSFAAVICSDAFHYFSCKATVMRELVRLSGEDGLILLAVLRNKLFQYAYAGRPLPPEGYDALASDLPHCLLCDRDVLKCYLEKRGPPLAQSADAQRLRQEPTLSLVATKKQDVFRDWSQFESWPHAVGHRRVNPVYVQERPDQTGAVRLSRRFPSLFYVKDNPDCDYLPEAIRVSRYVLDEVVSGKDTPEVEKLVARCVVLAMPDGFGEPTPLQSGLQLVVAQ